MGLDIILNPIQISMRGKRRSGQNNVIEAFRRSGRSSGQLPDRGDVQKPEQLKLTLISDSKISRFPIYSGERKRSANKELHNLK